MNKEIQEKMNDEFVCFDDFYHYLQDKDEGNWDRVNSEEIIKQYCSEKMSEGIHISHIIKALEEHPSEHALYGIWLGNSMETPTPINNKDELVIALDLEAKVDELKDKLLSMKIKNGKEVLPPVQANRDSICGLILDCSC